MKRYVKAAWPFSDLLAWFPVKREEFISEFVYLMNSLTCLEYISISEINEVNDLWLYSPTITSNSKRLSMVKLCANKYVRLP